MKIESTKNIIKQIEGTNTFEVKTVGKRRDLDELRTRLELHGFTFGEDGACINCKPRTNELVKLVKELTDDENINEYKLMELISKDAREYLQIYEDFRKKNFEFTYTLDMNNIEIVTETDENGNNIAKAIIDLKTNEDDGRLVFWKESNYNKEGIITINHYRNYEEFSYEITGIGKILDKKMIVDVYIDEDSNKIKVGTDVAFKNIDSIYNVVGIHRISSDEARLILIEKRER